MISIFLQLVYFSSSQVHLCFSFIFSGDTGWSKLGRWVVYVFFKETWRQEEDAISFLGFFSCAKVYFKEKLVEVFGE